MDHPLLTNLLSQFLMPSPGTELAQAQNSFMVHYHSTILNTDKHVELGVNNPEGAADELGRALGQPNVRAGLV
jgi:hypothetical protein